MFITRWSYVCLLTGTEIVPALAKLFPVKEIAGVFHIQVFDHHIGLELQLFILIAEYPRDIAAGNGLYPDRFRHHHQTRPSQRVHR